MENRFKMLVAVHLVLVQDDQVLLAKRFNTGYEDGKFSVPAGHVDEGESSLSAMVREAEEEVAITIQKEDLEFGHVMHRRGNRESVDFFFVCRKWQGTPKINEPDKCDGIEWFPINQLPENAIEYVKVGIGRSLENNANYTEMGY